MENFKMDEVGVIIGRFQVPDLHEGHISLIEYVLERHNKVCVVLGISSTRSTPNNALDYHTRYMMFKDMFKDNTDVTITGIMDTQNDEVWAEKLNEKLSELYYGKNFKLYGSRDSFIEKYKGPYKTELLESEIFISGTAIREGLKEKVISTYEFRCGVIYGANDRFFNAIPTVDVGLINIKNDNYKILLGRKKNEDKFRLFGGFVDVNDTSYENAAIRELKEEAGINIEFGNLKYITSCKIDDWRYRKEKQKIITNLYITEYLWGTPTPGDDIHELRWFNMNTLKKYDIMPEHHTLIGTILEKYNIPFDVDPFDI